MTRRMAFSTLRRDAMISWPQPRQRSLKSDPEHLPFPASAGVSTLQLQLVVQFQIQGTPPLLYVLALDQIPVAFGSLLGLVFAVLIVVFVS